MPGLRATKVTSSVAKSLAIIIKGGHVRGGAIVDQPTVTPPGFWRVFESLVVAGATDLSAEKKRITEAVL